MSFDFRPPADPARYSEADIARQRALSERTRSTPPSPRSLEALEADVENYFYASPAVRARLREFYARNPMRATRLVEYVVRAAQNDRLSMPDVYLGKKLREELEEGGT